MPTRVEPVEQTCATCGQAFLLPRYEQTRRAGQYCSWACNLARPGRQPKPPQEGHPRRSYAERDAAIVEAYLAGRSLVSIGRQTGLTRERVRQIVTRAGLPTQRETRRGRIRELVAAGRTIAEIAALIGLGTSAVSVAIKRMGLKARRPKPTGRTRLAVCKRGHDLTQPNARFPSGSCRACHAITMAPVFARRKADPEIRERTRAYQREYARMNAERKASAQRRFYARRKQRQAETSGRAA